MGAITKTFIVLNMVFSIAFVTVAGVVLAHRENWRDKYAKVEAQKRAEVKKLTDERDAFKQQVQNANTKLVTLRGKVEDLEGEKETLAREKTTALERARVAEENAEKARARADAKELLARQADSQKDAALTNLAEAKDQINAARRKVDEHETTMVGLRSKISSLRRKETELLHRLEGATQDNERYAAAMTFVQKQDPSLYRRAWRVGPPPPEKPIHSTVAAVDKDMGLIVLNKGAQSTPPIKKGYEFLISRGSEFIARVKVVRVDERVSAAEVIEPRTDDAPRVGDDARSEF
jgi:TolA-binding protein